MRIGTLSPRVAAAKAQLGDRLAAALSRALAANDAAAARRRLAAFASANDAAAAVSLLSRAKIKF